MIQAAIETLMKPVVEGWIAKIAQARKAKKQFDDIAMQCRSFYSASMGFMWKPEFQKQFMNGALSPKFQMTVAKAFELVAIMGPTLYWQNPQRRVRTRRQWHVNPQVLLERTVRKLPPNMASQGVPVEQMAQQFVQQQLQTEQQRRADADLRNDLMEQWLNYLPAEQPDGGLELHAEKAITETLVTGRGVLWVDKYKMPGSDVQLVGSFYESNVHLLIDPDAQGIESPTCQWVVRECIHPIWWVEREYGLPVGSLEGKGTLESGNSQGARSTDPMVGLDRAKGKTCDLMRYYRVYSKCGIGSRLTGMDQESRHEMDAFFGDHCYIVVAPGVDYPLNAPPDSLVVKGQGIPDDEIKAKFRWPIPFWLDNRWPCAVLDFYSKCEDPEKPDSWPIAPMAPGLGELTAINLMVSHLASRTWSSSRQLIGVLESAADQVEEWMNTGSDQKVLRIKDMHKSVKEVVSFLEQPQVNLDAWRILEMLMDSFDKRVGLSEILYGVQQTQSRSAAEIKIRESKAGIRPDYMAKKVEQWMKRVADMEKIATYFAGVGGKDTRHLLGDTGASLWDELVANAEPEIVLREMMATVEANSARRRNQTQDLENMNSILPTLLPVLSHHADVTGDTQPLNNLLAGWGDVIDRDMSDLTMQQRMPQPPPPEVMQIQQAGQQAEVANKQAEAAQKQALSEQAKATAMKTQIEAQLLMQQQSGEGQEDQLESARTMQEMQQSDDEHRQKMKQAGMQQMLDFMTTRREQERKDEQHNARLDQMANRERKPVGAGVL